MKKKFFVSVNSHKLKKNKASGEEKEQVFCKTRGRHGEKVYATSLAIVDARGNEVGRLVHSVSRPLKCGATAWLELDYEPQEVSECESPSSSRRVKEKRTKSAARTARSS